MEEKNKPVEKMSIGELGEALIKKSEEAEKAAKDLREAIKIMGGEEVIDPYDEYLEAGVTPGNLGKCQCAYCKEGMSATAEECVDRMVVVGKRLKEILKKYYGGEKCQNQS